MSYDLRLHRRQCNCNVFEPNYNLTDLLVLFLFFFFFFSWFARIFVCVRVCVCEFLCSVISAWKIASHSVSVNQDTKRSHLQLKCETFEAIHSFFLSRVNDGIIAILNGSMPKGNVSQLFSCSFNFFAFLFSTFFFSPCFQAYFIFQRLRFAVSMHQKSVKKRNLG